MFEKKIKRIQKQLKTEGTDALLLANQGLVKDDLLYWLLLKDPEYALMIIPKKGTPTLFAIPFEVEDFRREFPELNVEAYGKQIGEILAGLQVSSLSYQPRNISAALLEKLQGTSAKLQPLSDTKDLLSIKSKEEVQLMREAAQIGDEIFELLIESWSSFKTEQDAASFILVETARRGLTPSFPPIVASGAHGANPHAHPRELPFEQGFCVIDFGVRYKGYCSDMTRTIYIGKPSNDDRVLYDTVREAQQSAIKQVREGVTVRELDEHCRELLGEKLSEEFIHSLGHGLGTQIHEWPSVSFRADVTLKRGMVVTIEPGVYKQGAYGIRIEDDVVVEKNRCSVLTASPKELIIV